MHAAGYLPKVDPNDYVLAGYLTLCVLGIAWALFHDGGDE